MHMVHLQTNKEMAIKLESKTYKKNNRDDWPAQLISLQWGYGLERNLNNIENQDLFCIHLLFTGQKLGILHSIWLSPNDFHLQ